MNRCPKCNAETPVDARFCNICGYNLSIVRENTARPESLNTESPKQTAGISQMLSTTGTTPNPSLPNSKPLTPPKRVPITPPPSIGPATAKGSPIPSRVSTSSLAPQTEVKDAAPAPGAIPTTPPIFPLQPGEDEDKKKALWTEKTGPLPPSSETEQPKEEIQLRQSATETASPATSSSSEPKSLPTPKRISRPTPPPALPNKEGVAQSIPTRPTAPLPGSASPMQEPAIKPVVVEQPQPKQQVTPTSYKQETPQTNLAQPVNQHTVERAERNPMPVSQPVEQPVQPPVQPQQKTPDAWREEVARTSTMPLRTSTPSRHVSIEEDLLANQENVARARGEANPDMFAPDLSARSRNRQGEIEERQGYSPATISPAPPIANRSKPLRGPVRPQGPRSAIVTPGGNSKFPKIILWGVITLVILILVVGAVAGYFLYSRLSRTSGYMSPSHTTVNAVSLVSFQAKNHLSDELDSALIISIKTPTR